MAVVQGVREGVFIDEAATGDVDDAGAAGEEGEGTGGEDSGSVRGGEEYAIGVSQEVV